MIPNHSDRPTPLPSGASRFELRLHKVTQNIIYLLVAIALLVVVTLPSINLIKNISWHDQQRIGQIVIFTITAITSVFILIQEHWRSEGLFNIKIRYWITGIIAAAVLSACLAPRPVWAFTAVAVGVASLGLAWAVGTQRRQHGAIADRVLLLTLCFTCACLMARFLVIYIATIMDGTGTLDVWALLYGFSNPRFYGQFLTMALPLLAAPLMARDGVHRYALPAALLLVLTWTVAIASGTRGTWLGLTCAGALLACVSPAGRRWAVLETIAAIAGILLCWFALTELPKMLGIPVSNGPAGRLTTSLSERGPLWADAFKTALNHPLLGLGPMQLAGLWNGIATHPHQAWLQWTAELGFPSALVVTALVLGAARRLDSTLRVQGDSRQEADVLRLCLAGSIIAALTQSMVDGVLVMPYSQLWLALLAGWLIGLHPRPMHHGLNGYRRIMVSRPALTVWLASFIAAAALLGFVVIRDYPNLAIHEIAFVSATDGVFHPNFWMQGVIAPEAEIAEQIKTKGHKDTN